MTVFVLGLVDDDVEWVVRSLRKLDIAAIGSAPEAGGIAVVLHRSPGSVLRQLLARKGRTPDVAAALWERRSRNVLDEAEGHPALVAPLSAELAPLMVSFLSGHGVSLGTPENPGAPAPDGMDPWQPSPSQARLADVLDRLVGCHSALAVGDLGPETPSTDSLVAADRCFEEERGRLELCLSNATCAVEGLFPAAPPAPLAFGIRAGLDAGSDVGGYDRWIRRHEARTTPAPGREPVAEPVLSVVVTACRPDPALLARCLSSLVGQTEQGWELCLTVSAGEPAGTVPECVELDSRVRVAYVPADSDLAAAVNAGAALANGALITFVDQHDMLAADAFAGVVDAMGGDRPADMAYTDEDLIDREGRRSSPSFKPDWSPDLLLSTMYIGRLLVIRRSLFQTVGGLRQGPGEAVWYDLALRAAEVARSVAHVPSVAYHRDAIMAARGTGDVPAAAVVLSDALERRGVDATVGAGLTEGSLRVRYRIRSKPMVSVIVPFRDGADQLRRCVDSVRASGYDHWELVLVDNQSWEPETAALRCLLERDPRCRVIDDGRPFSWAAINNTAAEQAKGDVLLFLNSDIEGRQPGWLEAMVEHAQRPEVGAVGARLLYPDGRIQHAGVVMGLGGSAAWHAYCLCPGDEPGYLGHAKMVRNYSAVTGAAMMVRTALFGQLGGFDERFAVCFNDVDFCLRLGRAGYLIVYTPFAELVHHESSTRGLAIDGRDVDEMMRRWAPVIRRDPYFNPNLDARRSEFALPR